jgi:hypothetical protein
MTALLREQDTSSKQQATQTVEIDIQLTPNVATAWRVKTFTSARRNGSHRVACWTLINTQGQERLFRAGELSSNESGERTEKPQPTRSQVRYVNYNMISERWYCQLKYKLNNRQFAYIVPITMTSKGTECIEQAETVGRSVNQLVDAIGIHRAVMYLKSYYCNASQPFSYLHYTQSKTALLSAK